MKQYIFLAICIAAAMALLVAAQPALAQPLVPCGDDPAKPCQFCHIFVLVWNIVDFLMWQVAPPLAVLLFVVAGVLLLMSGANPGLRNQGKSMILGAIIGFAIALLAWLVINTIIIALTGSASFGGFAPWGWFDPPACP